MLCVAWIKQALFTPEDFQFDVETMQVTCPNGVVSKSLRDRTKEERKGYEFRFTKTQCQECPLRAQCTTSKTDLAPKK
jgi:hypothetical protein